MRSDKRQAKVTENQPAASRRASALAECHHMFDRKKAGEYNLLQAQLWRRNVTKGLSFLRRFISSKRPLHVVVGKHNRYYIWRRSSGGQSEGFIIPRSVVRAHPSPQKHKRLSSSDGSLFTSRDSLPARDPVRRSTPKARPVGCVEAATASSLGQNLFLRAMLRCCGVMGRPWSYGQA